MVRDVLEALSVGLTLPALLFCVWVIRHYHGTYGPSVFIEWDKVTPRDWIAWGIFVGFVGELLDGAYWGLTWLGHFYGWPITPDLIRWGVVVNIPTREVMVMMAAYGHIRASMSVQPDFDVRRLNNAAWAIVASGFAAFGLLILTRWF